MQKECASRKSNARVRPSESRVKAYESFDRRAVVIMRTFFDEVNLAAFSAHGRSQAFAFRSGDRDRSFPTAGFPRRNLETHLLRCSRAALRTTFAPFGVAPRALRVCSEVG